MTDLTTMNAQVLALRSHAEAVTHALAQNDFKQVDKLAQEIYKVAYSLGCNAYLYSRRTQHG